MKIKTTINIKKSQHIKISAIASQYSISISFIVNSLVKIAFKNNLHKSQLFQRVQYQERLSDKDDAWHCLLVSFQPDVYEKCLDIRKLSKVSVSFFIARSFYNFLNKFIKELQKEDNSDNYLSNYSLFCTKYTDCTIITLVWDKPEPEKVAKLQEIHFI